MPKFLNNIDLAKNQLQNALLHNLSGADPTPGAGDKGYAIFNTTSGLAKVWNGTSFDTISTVLEGVTGTAPIVAGAITGKSQAISITAASGAAAGSMSVAHYNLVNGATNANTASALVQRDGSGNFIAGTITANLTGTASTATTLAPSADVPMGSHRLTGLLDPASAQDAATKNYVDAISAGLDPKASVRLASTANVAVTYTAAGGASARGQITAAPNALDGINLVAGDRILLKNQTAGAQNGIWSVTTLGSGANGVWDRATDFNTDPQVTSGAFTFVEDGTTNKTSQWILSTVNPITIGGASGTALVFTQFGAAQTYTAGNGLGLAGGSFSVTGTTNRISVSGAGVDISSLYVGQASITTLGTVTTGVWTGTTIAVANGGTGAITAAAARTNLNVVGRAVLTAATGITLDGSTSPANCAATLGNGALTSFVVTHDRGTKDVQCVLTEVATDAEVATNVTHTSTTSVTLAFAVAPTTNQYRLVIVG